MWTETPTAICALEAAGVPSIAAASSRSPINLRIRITLTSPMQVFVSNCLTRMRKIRPGSFWLSKHFFSRKVVRPGIVSALVRLMRNTRKPDASLETTEGWRARSTAVETVYCDVCGALPLAGWQYLRRYFPVRSVSGRLDSQNERKCEVARI